MDKIFNADGVPRRSWVDPELWVIQDSASTVQGGMSPRATEAGHITGFTLITCQVTRVDPSGTYSGMGQTFYGLGTSSVLMVGQIRMSGALTVFVNCDLNGAAVTS